MKRILFALLICIFALSATAEEISVGAWRTNDGEILPAAAVQALETATKDLDGCVYEPVACLGTQQVAGTNYCLICRLTPVVLDPTPEYALVYVYADLAGGARITDIVSLDPASTTPAALGASRADGQNPVMNIVGSYADKVSQRAVMTIECEGEDSARVTINWGDSAYQCVIWRFSGVFDGETNTIAYDNCVKSIETCLDDGTVTETVVYENGVGQIAVTDEGEILWIDGVENAGEICLFTFNS